MSECVMRMNIKEMPAACGPCELSCTSICVEWTKIDRKKIGRTKSPDCPIIAILPEGHGRLVDADALDAAISDEIDESKWDNAGFTGYRVWSKVDEAPTIVPATNTPNKTPTNTPTATERSET